MSANIQKRFGSGPWLPWSSAATIDLAIEQVKGYAIGDDTHFRVIDEDGTPVFEWGPLRQVIENVRPTFRPPDVTDMGSVEVELRSDTFSGWATAAVAAARILKPRVGDKLTFKVLTQDRLQVWVDRA